MDRPVLNPLVQELRESERFAAFAEALPTRARVSEPALPLVLAALYEQLERPLLILMPEDADARDAAEAAGWYLGEERVALLPSRGVGWDSGLEPPPHLVGERARALDVLAAGGLVAASATALAEGLPPPELRPEPISLAAGDEPGLDALAERLALAGYERVDQVQERGQFAVRGGIVDVFPTTGREPLRVELFGDEVEAIRAFSPFTQRTLHPVDGALVYPAAERRRDLAETRLADDDEAPSAPDDLVPVAPAGPDLLWQPEDVRTVWQEELGTEPFALDGVTELDQLPSGQPFVFEAQRPAVAARGLAEAENELRAFVRAGNRVVVAFPHLGEALRTQNTLRRVEAGVVEQGDELPTDEELLFAVTPARRGFVWRDLGLVLLPDTQVFRKRVPRRAAPSVGRARQALAARRPGG